MLPASIKPAADIWNILQLILHVCDVHVADQHQQAFSADAQPPAAAASTLAPYLMPTDDEPVIENVCNVYDELRSPAAAAVRPRGYYNFDFDNVGEEEA